LSSTFTFLQCIEDVYAPVSIFTSISNRCKRGKSALSILPITFFKTWFYSWQDTDCVLKNHILFQHKNCLVNLFISTLTAVQCFIRFCFKQLCEIKKAVVNLIQDSFLLKQLLSNYNGNLVDDQLLCCSKFACVDRNKVNSLCILRHVKSYMRTSVCFYFTNYLT